MFLALAVAASGFAQQSLRISRIVDGDTVRGYPESGNEVRVRLTGIDAPEDDQPYGAQSTVALTALVGDGDVEMLVTDVDRYGRIVALLFRDGVNLNREMIASGVPTSRENLPRGAQRATPALLRSPPPCRGAEKMRGSVLIF